MKGDLFDVSGPFVKILETAFLALLLFGIFFAINQYNLIFLENSRDREILVVGDTVLSLSCLTENYGGYPVKALLSEDKINNEIALNPLKNKNINCMNYDKKVYVEIYDKNGNLLYDIGDSSVCQSTNPCKKLDTTLVTTFSAALKRAAETEVVNLKIFVGYATTPPAPALCGDAGYHCCADGGCRGNHDSSLDSTCSIGESCCQFPCCPDLKPGDTCPATCTDLCWCQSKGVYTSPGSNC